MTFLSDSFTTFTTVLLAHVVNYVSAALHGVHILSRIDALLMVATIDHFITSFCRSAIVFPTHLSAHNGQMGVLSTLLAL
jgi:hypothetical protein